MEVGHEGVKDDEFRVDRDKIIVRGQGALKRKVSHQLLKRNILSKYIRYICNIFLANGLHKAKIKNLRHCVSCLAQSSGRGCCCCRGLSIYQASICAHGCIIQISPRGLKQQPCPNGG